MPEKFDSFSFVFGVFLFLADLDQELRSRSLAIAFQKNSMSEDIATENQMEVDSPASESLQKEWNSFEKNQSGSADSSSADIKTGSTRPQDPEEDDDESHLPPGVRKKNRCHSSSSSSSNSDSEGDIKLKKQKDAKQHSDNSDSDSSAEGEKNSLKDNGKKKEETESQEKNKVKHRSTSRSKSRSQSPPSKRHRSSERSGKRSRSHSREHRHHRREKKNRRRSSSTSKRRSRDRDHHRRKRRDRSRDRKHSRSRSREKRRSRSHERRKTSRSRSRDRRRSRSRDRRRSRSHERRDRHRGSGRDRGSRKSKDARSNSRSRSRSPRGAKVIKYGDKVIKAGASFGRPPPSKPMTFKEKMRQQLIKAMEEGGDASQALTDKDGTVICRQTAGTMQIPQPQNLIPPPPKKPPVPLMANLVTSTASLQAATVSAAEAAMQSMLALQKETEEKTGVEIPKYYNPAAINPVKYAEQVQKRKLLWSKTKDKDVNSQWNATGLSSDHDDKSKEKFRKLMGIKAGEGSSAAEEETAEEHEKDVKQKELFDKLDKEYQFARMATHTHRGIGLGFGSVANYEPPPS